MASDSPHSRARARPRGSAESTEPATARILLPALLLALAGCHQRTCDTDLIPGHCDGSLTRPDLSYRVADAARLDIDGDGLDEIVAIDGQRAALAVHWPTRDLTVRPLDRLPQAIAAGDFDGDGATELALAGGSSTAFDLLRLTADGDPAVFDHLDAGAGVRDLGAGDLDGDGVDELISADGDDGTASLFRGGQRSRTTLAAGHTPVALVLGDLDGDGLLDLAARGATPQIWLHPGAPAGALAPPVVLDTLPTLPNAHPSDGPSVLHSIGVGIVPPEADIPGALLVPEAGELSAWRVTPDRAIDGRSALSRAIGPIDALLDGGGGDLLAGGPLLAAPLELRRGRVPIETSRTAGDLAASRPALGDFDGDGAIDLALYEKDDALGSALVILPGDGAGAFTEPARPGLPGYDDLIAADLDGDGADELLTSDHDGLALVTVADGLALSATAIAGIPFGARIEGVLHGDDGRDRLLVQHGFTTGASLLTLDADGTITTIEPLTPPASTTSKTTIADLDDDGDDDLIVIAHDADIHLTTLQTVLRTDGRFEAGPVHDLGALTGWDFPPPLVTVGDLDGDGAPELIAVGPRDVARIHDPSSPTLDLDLDRDLLPEGIPGARSGAAVGDHDRDGDDDLVFERGSETLLLSTDDGALVGPAEVLPLPYATRRFFRDLDGDGALDLVTISDHAASTLTLQSGVAPHLPATDSIPMVWSRLQVGDLDGDRIDDLLIAGEGRVTLVRHPRDPAPRVDSVGVGLYESVGGVVVDLDRDGRDEYLAGTIVIRLEGDRLRARPLDVDGDPLLGPQAAGDLDGDGLVDLIVIGWDGWAIAFGAGSERFEAPRPAALDTSSLHAVVDLDRDGLDDLVVVERGDITVRWSLPGRHSVTTRHAADEALVRPDRRILLTRTGPRIDEVPVHGRTFGAPRRVAEDPRLDGAELLDAGDLDGDGHRDLITYSPIATLAWLARGDALMLAGEVPVIVTPALAVGDFDGDGRGDLVNAFPDPWINWGDWR